MFDEPRARADRFFERFVFHKAENVGVVRIVCLAFLLSAVALSLRLMIAPVETGLQYVTFFPAVTLVAVLGGLWAGLLATLIGMVLATGIFTPPYYTLTLETVRTAFWSNLVFFLDGTIVSLAIEGLNHYRRRYVQKLGESLSANAQLEESSEHLKRILDNIFAYVGLLDVDGRVQTVNKPALERSGYGLEDVVGRFFHDAPWWSYDPHVQNQLKEAINEARNGRSSRYDVIVKMGRDLVPVDFQISPIYDRDKKLIGLLPTGVDITERKRAEAELRIAAVAFDSQESTMVTDAKGIIIKINRAFTETTGYSADEILGKTPRILKSGTHDAAFYQAMWDCINKTGTWTGEVWDRRKDGVIYPKWLNIAAVKDSRGVVVNYVGTHFDITERKIAEEKINALAFFDQLTGLPNRALLIDRLAQAMSASARNGAYGALLFIDLDNFKTVNDTLGHDKGDILLKQVAERLSSCVRIGDTVARLGGDEFVLMLAGLSPFDGDAAAQVDAVGEKILSTFNQPFQIGVNACHCTTSIGVTLFRGQEMTIDDLLKQADIAMYKSKAAGRNAIHFFDPEMEISMIRRAELEADLRQALHLGQFVLYYQPQVTDDGALIGTEVLVRWLHPTRGMVAPAEFIPLAEETGLILPLGYWILETACAQLAKWASVPGLSDVKVAVNVSARQFRQPDFKSQVIETLKRTGADPKMLKLELTESLLVENVQDLIQTMHSLKDYGVDFSLDDFGTGYSSLSYLKRLPLNQLKIDQSFVRDVLIDPNDAAIATTIVALGESLGLHVIAEGVETEPQQAFLAEAGCKSYQGYLFGRPLPVAEFEALADGYATARDAALPSATKHLAMDQLES